MKNLWTTFFGFAVTNIFLAHDIRCQVQHVDYGEDLLALHSEFDAERQLPSSIPAPLSMTPIDMLTMAIPGTPGEDYPILAKVPDTAFSCDGEDRVHGGYYADVEADCQPFHICADLGAGVKYKYSFLCPNGTMFSQAYFICDWWFNVDCSASEQFYSLNEEVIVNLDIAPFSPTQSGKPRTSGVKNSSPKFQSSQSQRRQKPFRANSLSSSTPNILNTYNPNRLPVNSIPKSYTNQKNVKKPQIFQENNSRFNGDSSFGTNNKNPNKHTVSPTPPSRQPTSGRGQETTVAYDNSKPIVPRNNNDFRQRTNTATSKSNILNDRGLNKQTNKISDSGSHRNGNSNKSNTRGSNNPTIHKDSTNRNKQRKRPSSQKQNQSNPRVHPNSVIKATEDATKLREYETDPTNSRINKNYGIKLSNPIGNKETPSSIPKTVFPNQRPHNKEIFNRRNKPSLARPKFSSSKPSNGRETGRRPIDTLSGVSKNKPSTFSTKKNRQKSKNNAIGTFQKGSNSQSSTGNNGNIKSFSGHPDQKLPPSQRPLTAYGAPPTPDYEIYGTPISQSTDSNYDQDYSTSYDDNIAEANGDTNSVPDGINVGRVTSFQRPQTGYGVPLADPIAPTPSRAPNDINSDSDILPDYDYNTPYTPNKEDIHPSRVPATDYGVPLADPVGSISSNAPASIDVNSDTLADYDYVSPTLTPNGRGNQPPRIPPTGYGVPLGDLVGPDTSISPNSLDGSLGELGNYDYGSPSLTGTLPTYKNEPSASISNSGGGNHPPQRPPTGYGVPLADPIGKVNPDSRNEFNSDSGTLSDYDYGFPILPSNNRGRNQLPQRPPTGYGVPLADPVGTVNSNLPNLPDIDSNDLSDYEYESQQPTSSNGQKNQSSRRPDTGYGVPLANPVGTATSSLPNSFDSTTNNLANYGHRSISGTSHTGGNKPSRRPPTDYDYPLQHSEETVTSNLPNTIKDNSGTLPNYDYGSTSSTVYDDYDYSTDVDYPEYDGSQKAVSNRPSTGYGVPLGNPIGSQNNPSVLNPDTSDGIASSQQEYNDYDQEYNTEYDENYSDPIDNNYSNYQDDGNSVASQPTTNPGTNINTPSYSPSTTPVIQGNNNPESGANNIKPISTSYGVPLSEPLGPTSNGLSIHSQSSTTNKEQGSLGTSNDNNAVQTTRTTPAVRNDIKGHSPFSTQTQRTTDGNNVTPRNKQVDHGKGSGQVKALPTNYGVPLAQPIGTQGISSVTNNNIGNRTPDQKVNIGTSVGNQQPIGTTSPDIFTLNGQNNKVFGISSSAVGVTQDTLGTGNLIGTTAIQPGSSFDQNIPSNAIPTIQTSGGSEKTKGSNEISNSSPQSPNFNNNNFPNQFQVIASLDPFQGISNNGLSPQTQFGINTQELSSQYNRGVQKDVGFQNQVIKGTQVPNIQGPVSNTFGPTVQSSLPGTTFDSSLDTYGSPSAGPLSAPSDNGISNQASVDSSYGAPLAEPVDDGYGAPKAAPIDLSYGAPLAPPVSQSYGAPLAAPLSRYQSKKNWPPPLPPQSAKPSFPSNLFGRSRRLSRYRHNFRNRFKRRFPTFHFRG